MLDELKRLRPRPDPARPSPISRRQARPPWRQRRPGAADRPVPGREPRPADPRPTRRPPSPRSIPRRIPRPVRHARPTSTCLGRVGSTCPSRREYWPQRGPDRRAGGRGPGLRPPAGGPAPRHQAVEPAAGRRGTVWVTDFGLAKADEGDELTHTGDIVGTLRYMAPERFAGQVRPAQRRLRPGADALRAADPAAGVRRGRPQRADRAGHARGAAAAARRSTRDPPRPGDDRPEASGSGPRSGFAAGSGITSSARPFASFPVLVRKDTPILRTAFGKGWPDAGGRRHA